MKKVLIITYYWPPSGGAGVQRWLKFSKYLPQNGWTPVILTVDPSYASFPQRDESLKSEIHPDCIVYKTKSFELYNVYKFFAGKKEVPFGGFANDSKESMFQKIAKFLRGNFLLPDPRKGWNNFAYQKACELISKYNIETVITTSPPHSTQLVGLKLKRNLDINWIADLRDPWTDIYYYKHFKHTAWAHKKNLKLERQVVESADYIITVSEDLKRIFAGKARTEIESKISVIPNGFDEEDFAVNIIQEENRKVITYSGTISEAYDIESFLDALINVKEKHGDNLLFRFVGNVPFSIEEKLRKTGVPIEFTGYVEHGKSIEYLFKSDILLLVIPKVDNNKGIITGKFFEYLASRKPILAIGPLDGDLNNIIEQTDCGKLFDYSDYEGIRKFLSDELSKSVENNNNEHINKYSRQELTRKLVSVLDSKFGTK